MRKEVTIAAAAGSLSNAVIGVAQQGLIQVQEEQRAPSPVKTSGRL